MEADIQIEERKQGIVQAGEIDGNRATRNNLVRTRLPLGKGDFLDLERTNRSRRSLYDTCAYSLVEIRPKPEQTAASIAPANQKPVTLQVRRGRDSNPRRPAWENGLRL